MTPGEPEALPMRVYKRRGRPREIEGQSIIVWTRLSLDDYQQLVRVSKRMEATTSAALRQAWKTLRQMSRQS